MPTTSMAQVRKMALDLTDRCAFGDPSGTEIERQIDLSIAFVKIRTPIDANRDPVIRSPGWR